MIWCWKSAGRRVWKCLCSVSLSKFSHEARSSVCPCMGVKNWYTFIILKYIRLKTTHLYLFNFFLLTCLKFKFSFFSFQIQIFNSDWIIQLSDIQKSVFNSAAKFNPEITEVEHPGYSGFGKGNRAPTIKPLPLSGARLYHYSNRTLWRQSWIWIRLIKSVL